MSRVLFGAYEPACRLVLRWPHATIEASALQPAIDEGLHLLAGVLGDAHRDRPVQCLEGMPEEVRRLLGWPEREPLAPGAFPVPR